MRERRSFPVSTLASGFPLAVDALVIDGGVPGPRVGISAMIHGDEIDGLLIIRELWNSVDLSALRGSLWLLPVANPPAFEAISRNTPVDMLDLNRVFPGASDGWLSEQLAYVIGKEFIGGLDAFIDIHAGGTFPWVDYCYLLNDEALARAFLSELLYTPKHLHPGTSAAVSLERGVPTMVVEIGGGYHDQADHIRNGVNGVVNILRQVGAMPGDVEHRENQLLLRDIKVMRPRQGGLCVPAAHLRPGARLGANTPLAEIVSPYTFDVLETMMTPFERNVVVLARNQATRIQPGDYAFMMGDGATATYF